MVRCFIPLPFLFVSSLVFVVFATIQCVRQKKILINIVINIFYGRVSEQLVRQSVLSLLLLYVPEEM